MQKGKGLCQESFKKKKNKQTNITYNTIIKNTVSKYFSAGFTFDIYWNKVEHWANL